MKKIFIWVLAFVLLALPSQARLAILIDGASDKKFPIAVPSFLTPSGSQAGGVSEEFQALLKKDLMLTGMFQVIDDSMLPKADSDTTTINFDKWQALEVGAVVKGIVEKGSGGLQIQVRVYSVSDKTAVLGKQYVINDKNYIDATHRFVDSLMEALTGFRGPFDSKIAASCGKVGWNRKIHSFDMDGMRLNVAMKKGVNLDGPSWSPDGSRLAYKGFNEKTRAHEIYVDGKAVTHFNGTTITPTWTPDGSSLLVASSYGGGGTHIYNVSLSGRVLKKITNGSADDINPSVHPSGKIVYASSRSGGLQLFATTLSGAGNAQLTYTGYQNDQGDWTPDGSRIVFSGRDQGTYDIFVMEADGSNIVRLTGGEGSNEGPTWSPDGRFIAFSSPSRGGIFVMRDDGTSQTRIEGTETCINPDWSGWLSE